MEQRLNSELDLGALGIGMGIQYTPGATRLEIIQMFRLAAMRGCRFLRMYEVLAALNPDRVSRQSAKSSARPPSPAPRCKSSISTAAASPTRPNACPWWPAPVPEASMSPQRPIPISPDSQRSIPHCSIRGAGKARVGYDALQMPDTGEKLTKETLSITARRPCADGSAHIHEYPGHGRHRHCQPLGHDRQRR